MERIQYITGENCFLQFLIHIFFKEKKNNLLYLFKHTKRSLKYIQNVFDVTGWSCSQQLMTTKTAIYFLISSHDLLFYKMQVFL